MRRGLARLGTCLGLWIVQGCMPGTSGLVADAAAELDGASPSDGGTFDAALDPPVDAATPPDDAGPPPRRVLFVGNSYTDFNDLPLVVRELSGARDDVPPLEVESVLVDGATLWDHWTTTGARERIETGAFDVVVLQGQSTEPIRDGRGFSTAFSFARNYFAEAALATGARVVLFVTWARRAGHPDYERLSLGDPTTMTNDLVFFYGGNGGSVTAAQVGLAFQIALAELPEVELYADDGSHPSAAGSFLAGCVLAQMVGGEHPRVPSAVPLGLERETAEALCAIAPRVACITGTFCHGSCVRTESDALHCGACDAACPGDFPCAGGICTCPYPEWSPCPGRYCAHLGLDEYNCGACGNRCEAGQQCLAGACECTSVSRVEAPAGRLAELRPGCVRGSPTEEVDCAAAIAEHCASLSCFDTGVPVTPYPAMAPGVLCISGELRTTSFDVLRAHEPGCTGIDVLHAPACVTAIHRACIAAGAISGLPSSPSDAKSVTTSCFARGEVVRTTFTALASALWLCDGTSVRSGAACTAASAWTCQAMGHAGGYGPVETMGDDVDIVCVDE
jgi:hypothetical protein